MQPVSEEALTSCDLETPILTSTCVDTDDFERQYLEAAKAAEEAGAQDQALVYRLLAAICTFHFRPEDKIEPFSNRIGFADGSRSLIGSDFEKDQISSLHAILPRFKKVPLRTRVADLIWYRDRSRADCARIAVDGYVELVKALIEGTATERFHEPDPTGVGSEKFLQRPLVIARATGWSREQNDELRRTLAEVLRLAVQRGDMSIARMGALATDVRLEEADEILADIPAKIDELISKPDFFVAEEVQKLVIRRVRRSNDDELIRQATLRLTSIFEAKAEKSDGAMLKAHALQQAIDSLHGIKGVREERQRLHEKLKEAQLHMVDEFSTIEHSTDLSSEVERLLAGYDGLSLLDALLRLVLTELPKDPNHLEQAAREEAEKFPLSSLFSTVLIDSRGRTVARAGGTSEGSDALRHKVIQHENIRIGLAMGGAINPARQMLTERFVMDENLFYEIGLISPFVPSGTEHAFARGMQAFMYGDDFLATAALVPLLEAGMRATVEAFGRSETKISAGGIETTIGLGPLLSDHRDALEKTFTPGIVYAIENLFVHELGPKVRHEYCHGLTHDNEFYSQSYAYANKLIFSLVLLPLGGRSWEEVKTHIVSRLGLPKAALES